MASAEHTPPGPVAILYDELALSGDAASQDVAAQMDAVETALRSRNVETLRIGAGLDLGALKAGLRARPIALAFNLVESLDGSDRLQSIVPMLLESWGVPFTGSGSAAMLLSNHKIGSKARLAGAGLPVAECAWLDARGDLRWMPEEPAGGDFIVKTLESHASLFIDDASVMRAPGEEALADRLRELAERHGMPFFAERYIEGREFNLSLVDGADGVLVLPPAEILFAGLPPGKPRIVGYAAKWEETSAEYLATPRTFSFQPGDAALLEELKTISLAVWRVLGLSGYARVDFRVDAAGEPFILEANANPCISPDAGMAAAAEEAGYDYGWLVARIAAAAGFFLPDDV